VIAIQIGKHDQSDGKSVPGKQIGVFSAPGNGEELVAIPV